MNKVAREVAEQEFDRMCEARDLDVDISGFDDEDKKTFESLRRIVVKAIEAGRVMVEEDGTVVLTLKFPRKDWEFGELRFGRPSGETIIALGSKKSKNKVEDLFGAMGQMCGVSPKIFEHLDHQTDLKIAQSLTNLFLG